MIQNNHISAIFDLTLKPQNATKRGYKYIDDIIYKPGGALAELLKLSEKYQYKLGAPKIKNDVDSYYGLYIPIK